METKVKKNLRYSGGSSLYFIMREPGFHFREPFDLKTIRMKKGEA